MQGTITGKDVLVHSLTILRLWGPSVYIRCLRAMVSRRPCTFLGVVSAADPGIRTARSQEHDASPA